jgi:hypothetical protein
LIFKAKNDGKTSSAVKISSQITSKESYDQLGNAYNLELRFKNSSTEDGLVLYQNRPNPFVNETMVSFNLPQSGAAKISIIDATGRILKVIEKDFTKGYNEIKLDKNSIGTSGVMFIQLEQNNQKASKQMISID